MEFYIGETFGKYSSRLIRFDSPPFIIFIIRFFSRDDTIILQSWIFRLGEFFRNEIWKCLGTREENAHHCHRYYKFLSLGKNLIVVIYFVNKKIKKNIVPEGGGK